MVLGEGGSRLLSLIEKSEVFVPGVNLHYLDSNSSTNGGRKVFNSDSGYSSQLSSAFESDLDTNPKIQALLNKIKVKCTDVLTALVDNKSKKELAMSSYGKKVVN